MKVCTVLGARPQFVKAAMVSRALLEIPGASEMIIHTGQHYDDNLSDIFFKELEIPKPAANLGIGSAMHGAQTGRMLEALEEHFLAERPDWVLVYGDTNSTLAGALAAVKLHIPVAHVEAGPRSFDWHVPEEINRVLTDHAAQLLFAPTEAAAANLLREGIPEHKVHHVGDVMYDAALYYGRKAVQVSQVLGTLGLEPKSYALTTVHRPQNTDWRDRLKAIIEGLSMVAGEIPVVLPLHPRTRAALEREDLLERASESLILIDPVGYLDMVMLEQNARLIATDSGGVQKEAFFYRVPCVTLREETEWVELVEFGWNRLVPPSSAEGIAAGVLGRFCAADESISPYGEGDSARKIVRTLKKESHEGPARTTKVEGAQ